MFELTEIRNSIKHNGVFYFVNFRGNIRQRGRKAGNKQATKRFEHTSKYRAYFTIAT